jgi:hypothetical protein
VYVDENEHSMLARLDERVQSMQKDLHVLTGKFNEYVTHIEFTPVKMIAFGLAALILCSVLAAVVATVLHK